MDVFKIALSAGDYVGEELLSQARKVFRALDKSHDVHFELQEFLSCGSAIQQYGTALRDEDMSAACGCQAVLFGNIGYNRSEGAGTQSPVYALTAMRHAFGVCTNIRPVRLRREYEALSPLKREITQQGMDILIVRDLMGGMINGERHTRYGRDGQEASDLEYYNEEIISHSARFAFQSALNRKSHVTSVDKANILSSSKLWREKVINIGKEYVTIRLDHDYVDHAAMELLIHPERYDVILTSNVFGDILADEVAQISGAPWLFGSAELAMDGRGIFTPNQLHHPRGEELAGKNMVSPYGILDAISLLLRYCCGRDDMASLLDAAIQNAITRRLFTAEAVPPGGTVLSCEELGSEIASNLL